VAQPQVTAQATSSGAVRPEPEAPSAGVASVTGVGAPGDAAAEPAYDLDFDSIGLQEAPRTSPKTLPFEAGLEEEAARLSEPRPGESAEGAEVAQGPLASTTLAELYLCT